MMELHVHTTRCDGSHSPKEMAKAAADMGLSAFGFSGHSHTPFDESYCMPKDGIAAYCEEVTALKAEYAGRMQVLLGLEWDRYSDTDLSAFPFDYVIGSVHYVKQNGVYLPVDESRDDQLHAAERHFGGDMLAFCEAYFATVAELAEVPEVDIVGHIDLVAKFNQGGLLFDENHPRYLAAAFSAIDRLLAAGKVLEINTGAMSRGYRSTPYPARPLLEYVLEEGGKTVLSGDCHSTDGICHEFHRFRHYATETSWQDILAARGR